MIHRTIPVALLALTVASGGASAQVTFRDLAGLSLPGEVAISGDGKRIAFELTEVDLERNETRTRVWMYESGSALLRQLKSVVSDDVKGPVARPMTREGEDATSPRFLEDGETISFLSDGGDGSGRNQVWVLPASGGMAQRWTSARNGVERYEWTRKGTLYYLAKRPWPPGIAEYREIRPEPGGDRRPLGFWRVERAEEEELVFSGDPGIREFSLSYDGGRIVYSSNGDGDPANREGTDLFVLDLATGESRRLTDRPGDERSPVWSDDGSTVYFLAGTFPEQPGSQTDVWGVPVAGGELVNLTENLDHDVLELKSCRDKEKLFAVVAHGTDETLYRIHPFTNDSYRMFETPGRVQNLVVRNNGEKAAFFVEGPSLAPEGRGVVEPGRLLRAPHGSERRGHGPGDGGAPRDLVRLRRRHSGRGRARAPRRPGRRRAAPDRRSTVQRTPPRSTRCARAASPAWRRTATRPSARASRTCRRAWIT